MKQKFLHLTIRPQKIKMLDTIDKILYKYQQLGYKLTSRQLYYELVSQGIIPNKQNEYVKLIRLLENGRMMGLIDWNAINDSKQTNGYITFFGCAQTAILHAADNFKMNRQAGQSTYIEVWTENESLFSLLYKITQFYNINLEANQDCTSYPVIYNACRRIRQTYEPCTILYLGDLDTSRPNTALNIRERFKEFGLDVDVQKIGLTIEQVLARNLPLNPAKIKKPRAKTYNEKFESVSWELDALKPYDLESLLKENIESVIDTSLFIRRLDEEKKQQSMIYEIERNFYVS